MRKITFRPILCFCLMLLPVLSVSILGSLLVSRINLGQLTGILCLFVFVLLFYVAALAVYRLFSFFFPLEECRIEEKSTEEFIHHVHLLFYLFLF